MNALLKNFIESHWDKTSPLLIGLSGGPDSRLLLHLLLELQITLPFDLAIAHVDHRWRDCSEAEALALQELAQSLGLKFHLKILNPKSLQGNLEAACRNERLQFFRELSEKYGYQAVFLGHHADDQAETILKRLFEGCTLSRLNGLLPVITMEGLTLWRPFLSTWKKDLLEQLATAKIQALDDKTNRDPQFLRARLRENLLPWMSQQFGKEIKKHLLNLGSEAQELQAYLDRKIDFALKKEYIGPFGVMLDLKNLLPNEFIEQKHLVRSFAKKWNLPLSKEGLTAAATFLREGAAGKTISCGSLNLCIDRYCLFIVTKEKIKQEKPLTLSLGTHKFGNWSVIVKEVDIHPTKIPTHWLAGWLGEVETFVSAKNSYRLSFPEKEKIYPRKLWNNAKVPFFLRENLPVILEEDDTIIHEFLSGRLPPLHKELPLWHVSLKDCSLHSIP